MLENLLDAQGCLLSTLLATVEHVCDGRLTSNKKQPPGEPSRQLITILSGTAQLLMRLVLRHLPINQSNIISEIIQFSLQALRHACSLSIVEVLRPKVYVWDVVR